MKNMNQTDQTNESNQEEFVEETKKIGYKDILKQKEYMKTVVAAVINRFGDAVDSVAFTWLVYMITGSAAWSALIFGINRLPSVFLQPFAGAIVEGKNKKHIMIISDIIRGGCVAVIILLNATGNLSEVILVINTLIISSVEAFRNPAGTAILPKILEKKYYDFGLSLETSLCNIIDLIGLAIGGVIVAALGISGAMYIDLATFLISAIIIITLRVKETGLTKEKLKIKQYFETMLDGFSYVKGSKKMMYFLILALFLNAMLVPVNCLQAPIVKEIFNSTEVMLSVIGVTLSVGMLVASFIYPYIKEKVSEKQLIVGGSSGISLLYIGYFFCSKIMAGTAVQIGAAILITFLSGMTISFLSSLINIEIVKSIDEKYLARIMALMSATAMAAMPIMSFFISGIAKIVTVEKILLFIGCVNLIGSFYIVNAHEEDKIEKKTVALQE